MPFSKGNMPLLLTFNKTPNIENVNDKHWYILSINENLRKVFDKRPLFIDYRTNNNLHQLIRGNHIFKNKVVHKNTKRDIVNRASQE